MRSTPPDEMTVRQSPSAPIYLRTLSAPDSLIQSETPGEGEMAH